MELNGKFIPLLAINHTFKNTAFNSLRHLHPLGESMEPLIMIVYCIYNKFLTLVTLRKSRPVQITDLLLSLFIATD